MTPSWARRLLHKIRGGASAPDYENNIDMRTNGELRLLREVAPSLRVAFDVGANVGDWIERLISVAPGVSRVYAFEPSRPAYDRLSSRSFPPSVLPRRIGFSSRPGTAALHVFGEASGMNSLHDRRGLEDGWGIGPASATEEVTLDTLDRFCRSENISEVDFLKIDTEGHEVDVLEGARESLRRGLFAMIQFEYGGTYIDSRRLLKDVFALFSSYDYIVFLVTPRGLAAYPRYDQRLENFQYKNFVALRRDAIARIPSAVKGMRETAAS